jgi:hypothetical protein
MSDQAQFGEQYAGWMAYDAEDGTEHIVWCQFASTGILVAEDQDAEREEAPRL